MSLLCSLLGNDIDRSYDSVKTFLVVFAILIAYCESETLRALDERFPKVALAL